MEYKIESVAVYKGETVEVRFDCREPIYINASVVYDLGLRSGKAVSDEDIENAVNRNDFRRAKERALYLLDNRDYSYAEIFKKLEQNYPEEICYEVANSLAQAGLIDDRRYARKCAEYFMVTKMRGVYRAREEMRRRGIPNSLIDEAIAEFEEGSIDRIRELIEGKYARKLSEEGGKQKVKAALARQGFTYDEINEALEEDRGQRSD